MTKLKDILKPIILSMVLCLPLMVISGCGGETTVVAGFVSTEDGEGAQGVVIIIVGDDEESESEETLTDEEGWYSHENQELSEDDKVSIIPSHPDYEFTPEKYVIDGGNSEVDLDFVARPR